MLHGSHRLFAVSEVWVWLVTGIGLLTLFWGSIFAVKQTDLKAILAFSTVSQLGLIMSLLGAGAIAYPLPMMRFLNLQLLQRFFI